MAMRRGLGPDVHAAAHITGGGITGNVARILPPGLGADIDMGSFSTPEIFFAIQRAGHVSAEEMVRVFNCGLGMVTAVAPGREDEAIAVAAAQGVEAQVVGTISAHEGVTLR
jgi:phosphoribosylformylglycinamidine cyclo-ligase